jgi:excisionase family DNA binding protein
MNELLEARLFNIETMLKEILNKENEKENRMFSVKELSKYANVSELSIRNWIKEGKLEAKRLGGRILIDENQFKNGLQEVKSLKYKR